MIGDLLGEGESINIAVEVQKSEHASYAVRGTLTSSNSSLEMKSPEACDCKLSGDSSKCGIKRNFI